MIVKDAEPTLGRCLESVRGVVDEIVIADTGSADHSIDLARQHGATVFDAPWERDFAKARNRSLSCVTSDWVLVLDADEILDPDAPHLLASHLADEGVMGYTVRIKNYLSKLNCHLWDQEAKPNTDPLACAREFPAYVEHVNVRLFRRNPDIWFEGCVHETVGYRMVELGMRIEEARFFIHHLGFVHEDDVLARKYFFYRELGREKVRAMPENALAHFELGLEESEHFHKYEDAAALFKRACELNPRFGVAWLFYARTLALLGKHPEALEALERADETGAKRELVLEARGDSCYNSGDFARARRCYEELLQRPGESPQIESKLGLAEVRLGLTERGLARLREAVSREPSSPQLYDRLISAGAWLGRLPEAAEAAEEKLAQVGSHPNFYLRAASLRAQMNDGKRATDILRRGLDRFPKNENLSAALAETERRRQRPESFLKETVMQSTQAAPSEGIRPDELRAVAEIAAQSAKDLALQAEINNALAARVFRLEEDLRKTSEALVGLAKPLRDHLAHHPSTTFLHPAAEWRMWRSVREQLLILLERTGTLPDPPPANLGSPPGPVPLKSCLCSQAHIEAPWYGYWCSVFKDRPKWHRKQWEWCFIAQALKERGMLGPGSKGLGFGVGEEPLSDAFAARGCAIVATDLDRSDTRSNVWANSRQHAATLALLNRRGICDPAEFGRLVTLRPADMNAIPPDLTGFDFTWSACSLDHLGTLEKASQFILNSLRCLRPGGVAVHTTEFNIVSNQDTVTEGETVIFRCRDIEAVAEQLRSQGHHVEIDWTIGNGIADNAVDVHPLDEKVHLRLQLYQYLITSIGLIIEKAR